MISQFAINKINTLLQIHPESIETAMSAEARGLILRVRCRDELTFNHLCKAIPINADKIYEVSAFSWIQLILGDKIPLEFPIAEMLLFQPEPEPEEPPMETTISGPVTTMHPGLNSILPVARALNCSVFVMDYEGIYLHYQPRAGARPIVPIEQQLGNRGIDLLPPTMRNLVRKYFDLAVATGQQQQYEYCHERDGVWSRCETIVIPYPEFNQVVSLVRRIEVHPAPADNQPQETRQNRE